MYNHLHDPLKGGEITPSFQEELQIDYLPLYYSFEVGPTIYRMDQNLLYDYLGAQQYCRSMKDYILLSPLTEKAHRYVHLAVSSMNLT